MFIKREGLANLQSRHPLLGALLQAGAQGIEADDEILVVALRFGTRAFERAQNEFDAVDRLKDQRDCGGRCLLYTSPSPRD